MNTHFADGYVAIPAIPCDSIVLASRLVTMLLKPTMSAVEFVSFLITLCLQPFLCLIGALLNLACLFVLIVPLFQHNYCRKTSLLIYLIALSVCNAVQLTLSVFVIIFPASEQFIDDELYSTAYQDLRHFNSNTMFLVYPVLMASNYAALWTLTLICAQRYQSLCNPTSPWKSRLNVFRKSKRCLVCVLALAIIINLPRYSETRFAEAQHELYQSVEYKIVQEGVVYGLLVYGVPMVVLIWLNYHTIRAIWLDKDERSQSTAAEHRTAHMTICFFILFFLCTTMSISLRLIAIFAGDTFFSIQVIWLVDLSNLLSNANALTIPIVCFAFTRGFQDLFFVIRYPHNQHHQFKSLLPVQL